MKARPPLLALYFVTLGTLAGCSSLQTQQTSSPPQLIHGMPYYLPVGLLTIKGTYTEPKQTPDGPKGNETHDDGKSEDKESPPPSDTSTANSVTFTIDNWTITITAEVEADPDWPQYVIPQRNYIFDDEYHVTVNAKHLLTTGKTIAEDKSANIAGAVASLVGAVARRAQPAVPAGLERYEPFLITFHPTDQVEFQKAHDLLEKRGFELTVRYPETATQRHADADLSEAEQHGLAFRLGIPFEVSLHRESERPTKATVLEYRKRFILPGTQTYVFDYRRMPFVKKVTEVAFTDGMLTDYHENLPSPILGVLGIPKAILAALVPLPSATTPVGTGSTAAAGQ